MTRTKGDIARHALEEAERRAFAHYGLDVRTRFVRLSDPPLRVRTLEAGDGPPMLLIGGPSASAWAPLMAELRGFRLIAVDRPGCGLSDPFDYTHADLRAHGVQFLSSLMDQLGLEAPAIAGNSMGGLWALWLAVDRPDRVSVIGQLGCPALLLNTSAPLSKRVLSIRAVNRIAQASSKHALVDHVTGRDGLEGLPEEMRECLYRAKLLWGRGRTHLSMLERMLSVLGARPELRFGEAELARVDRPVIFIWGDDDDHGSPEAGRRACEILPRGQIVVVGAGHMPWLDRPGECADALGPFVRASVDAASEDGRVARGQRRLSPAPPTPGSEIEWLQHVLWERASSPPSTGHGSGPRQRSCQRYAAFPTPSRPLSLTPLATRAAASASLRRYNALRPLRRRAVRASVGIGLRVGLVQPFIRRRLRVEMDGWTADGDESLLDHLRAVFGVPEVIVSISLSRPGPFRKPMLQVLTPRGGVLGFVKVGWNELTSDLVRSEASNLGLCATGSLSVGVPEVIHSGPVGPLHI
ncbi:MAG TPA: alpha/beta hydrolase, partial [Actinomycetota bacterium]|nr:alpha/beta hydrolase [Actinomycetota bacterium]